MSVEVAGWAFVAGLIVGAVYQIWTADKKMNADYERLKKQEKARGQNAMRQQKAFCDAVKYAKERGYATEGEKSMYPWYFGFGGIGGLCGFPHKPRPEPEPEVLFLEYKPRD